MEGRIDKDVGTMDQQQRLPPSYIALGGTTTATSCCAYTNTPSLSRQLLIQRCDAIMTPVIFSTTTSSIS